ncbi:MAG: riboflavin synthase, partial [Gammaproteobacteria bacterium]
QTLSRCECRVFLKDKGRERAYPSFFQRNSQLEQLKREHTTMFTGIIDHCGILSYIEPIPGGLHLKIKTQFTNLELGESIAINGICLTVTDFQDNTFGCDISPETLKVTTANQFKTGQHLNLERALLPSTRMGGHFVMGHVDQTAEVTTITAINDFIELKLGKIDQEAKKFITKKGSIAINGVSLTINEVTAEGCSVMLIPHTQERTNLNRLQKNDLVNIEFDMLARMVTKHLESLTNE